MSPERSTTPPSEALPASALPLPHEVLVWRGMKATPTILLIDALVVGDQLEKALIEETARRRRAEVLLFATQQAYVREHEASVVPSETACSETSPHGLWVVWYEDPAKEHEVFFGDGSEAAARARYKSAYDNWSCHLLRRVPHGK